MQTKNRAVCAGLQLEEVRENTRDECAANRVGHLVSYLLGQGAASRPTGTTVARGMTDDSSRQVECAGVE